MQQQINNRNLIGCLPPAIRFSLSFTTVISCLILYNHRVNAMPQDILEGCVNEIGPKIVSEILICDRLSTRTGSLLIPKHDRNSERSYKRCIAAVQHKLKIWASRCRMQRDDTVKRNAMS